MSAREWIPLRPQVRSADTGMTALALSAASIVVYDAGWATLHAEVNRGCSLSSH